MTDPLVKSKTLDADIQDEERSCEDTGSACPQAKKSVSVGTKRASTFLLDLKPPGLCYRIPSKLVRLAFVSFVNEPCLENRSHSNPHV